jgi:hypothetical protein
MENAFRKKDFGENLQGSLDMGFPLQIRMLSTLPVMGMHDLFSEKPDNRKELEE